MSIRTKDPRPTERPTWADYWDTDVNEAHLFARELIDVTQAIRAHFEGFLSWREEPCMVDVPGAESWDPGVPDPEGWIWRDAHLDWAAAAVEADRWPCSTTERRMLDLILSLVQPDEEHGSETRRDDEGSYYQVWVTTGTRKVDVRDLGRMGSWQIEVAEILFRYMSGGTPRRLT